MMALSTTEIFWFLALCNKIHCIKVHSLIYYVLLKIIFLIILVNVGGLDSVVGPVTRLQAWRSGVGIP